jgi:isobutyryl-CoA dehydrogenase
MARMATKLVASRMMIRNAATALEESHPNHVTLCSMAKLYATEACFEVFSSFHVTINSMTNLF